MATKSPWNIIVGRIPALLVASHNYPHIRKGKIKPRDIGTGLIVEKLFRQTSS